MLFFLRLIRLKKVLFEPSYRNNYISIVIRPYNTLYRLERWQTLILCDTDRFKSINEEEASPEILISRADKCLYEAKEKGRNSVSSLLNGGGVRGG